MKTLYYIEKDGQIFLVRKKGILNFPAKKEIPFEIEILRQMPVKLFRGARVFYCHPKIKDHPDSWPHKDSVPEMDNVDKIVRIAVNRSLVRHVSDAVIAKNGKVLMVKSSRGLITDIWDIPGGFINYGESPESSLIREVKEETGLDIKIKSLLTVNTNVSKEFGLYFLALIYLCEPAGGRLRIDKSEIKEAGWFPLDEAIRMTKLDFVKESLRIYKEARGKNK